MHQVVVHQILHTNNIVHLYLSLKNTMLGKPLETKIIGFGLGKQFDLNNNPGFKNNSGVRNTVYMTPKVFNKPIILMVKNILLWWTWCNWDAKLSSANSKKKNNNYAKSLGTIISDFL